MARGTWLILGETLAERYEAMRRDVLEGGAGGVVGHGVAVLARRGIVAWMRAWSESGQAPMPRSGSHDFVGQVVPKALAPEIVNVLATMVLGAQAGEALAG